MAFLRLRQVKIGEFYQRTGDFHLREPLHDMQPSLD
jgi:hypothetical protein